MKRGELLVFFAITALLIAPIISASIFSDWWGRITGQATSDTASLNISVGNSAPTIPFVLPITPQDLSIGTFKAITFNFTATDSDGAANLNDATAQARFNLSGETTRSNTSCVTYTGWSSGNNRNYSCTINMWYFDGAGNWTINATIQDISAAKGENSSTNFQINQLTAMNISPTNLTWPQVGLNDANIHANENITINNTGNDFNLDINVTARDLRGDVDNTRYIFSNNFTVHNVTQVTCTITQMQNATSKNITNATLQRGNNSLNFENATSGQEEIVTCLKGVPANATAQSYSTASFGAWTVQIVT